MINSLDKEIIGKEKIESYKLLVSSPNYHFSIPKNTSTKIELLLNVQTESNITIDLNENSNLKLIIIASGSYSYKLDINVYKDASLKLYTADSFDSDVKVIKSVNLKESNAYSYIYEYLPANNNKITGGFYLNHLFKDTKSEGFFNYLSKNNGIIDRNATSTLIENTNNSESSENIKGLILGEQSRIDAKPVLIVKCDDVHAAHGCAIGTINANEIYYLMSRGLTYDDSLKIICKSLINPILRELDGSELKDEVSELLNKTIGE